MAPAGREAEDDDPDLGDDDPFAEAPPPTRSPPAGRRGRAGPPRPWDAPEDELTATEWKPRSSGRRRFAGEPKPVYWRARDSLYFEPLVALAIVVLLLVGLFAFTHNWPPAYVVESVSMQHGTEDKVGLINAGDLVLAEKAPNSTIVPYVTGYQTDVKTYGEYGDVILYHPNGESRGTPIVHRAILFLEWNGTGKWYDAPDLRGLTCVANTTVPSSGLYYATDNARSCRTVGLSTSSSIQLYNVGWDDKRISLDLAIGGPLGEHSGYVTMGDNNPGPDQNGTSPLSSLVEPGWILGVARGMLPWYGAFKLLLEGNARNVSSVSWQFLGLSLIVALLAAFGIHYALRQEGIESPMRRREEEEEAAETEAEEEERPPHRFLGSIRAWPGGGGGRSEEEERSEPPPKASGRAPPRRPPNRTDDARSRHRARPPRRPTRPRDDDADS